MKENHDLAFFELFGNKCQSCKLGWQPFNQSANAVAESDDMQQTVD
jgi:hypothetical protein